MAETPAAGLGREELNQRVAILRRFRALLAEQRDRFRAYLEELDTQKDVIETGSAEELIAHVEMEEKIVADIFAIQKVIVPLDTMYRSLSAPSGAAGSPAASGPAADSAGAETEVLGLKSALDNLKKEAVIRSGRNKEILSRRLLEMREEIKSLRANPYRSGAYAAGSRSAGPSLVDITG
ncbi:MAG: flagellar biosynthesis protein FlgN [Treponema sp.]|jgi:hypothetical protein|nr:flagellar biosynthesis protein FlgN [Treponema sp.]